MSTTIVCWNVNWAKPGSVRANELQKRIMRQKPEVACVSEGYTGYLEQKGHTIYSEADYGYSITEGRRKVFLWSEKPWRNIDPVGHPSIPSGRYISGITQTSEGDVRIVGLCIAWQMAHVSTGRKNAAPWEVHMDYLKGLEKALSEADDNVPTVLIGDFNQRLPRGRQPLKAFGHLTNILSDRFEIWSWGAVKRLAQQPVCHIGGDGNLECQHLSGRTRFDRSGKQLTDHDGLVARFRVR